MNRFSKSPLNLSPRKRTLLGLLLQEEGIPGLPIPGIAHRQDSGSLALSFAQQRLWFLDQLEPGSPVYNIIRVFFLSGSLNLAALEQSLDEIVRRHEVLRTSFPMTDGKAVQVVSPPFTGRILSVVDLAELPQGESEPRIRQLAYEEAQRPFNLVQGPLLRIQLLRQSTKKYTLLLSIHHIVCDGWSLNILIRELSKLYQAYSQDLPSPLTELPLQYTDYALWQSEWLQGAVLKEQLVYWEQHLQGAPPVLELPVDHPPSTAHTSQGAHYTYELPQELSEALATLSRQENVTLFMTLLAAFATLLSRYSRQEDFVIGTPIANRTRVEIKDLIGNFANTLALRFDLSGAPRFQSLLARVREVCLDGYTHQDLPFEYLVEVLEPERNLHHSPLCQVLFAYQSSPPETLHLPGLTVSSPLISYPSTARMDLMLTIVSTPQGLRLDFEYRKELFEASTIAHMASHMQRLLESIVIDPRQSLGDLTMLTQSEQQSLLNWNATQEPYPRHLCVHQLIEAQVERRPECIALVCEDEHLTYHELNQRANRLAQYLRTLDVGPEKLVGLCLERSPDLIVAMLAILKAGGAYIPLDPGYPSERLAFMLTDAQATLLLTQQSLQERVAVQGLSIVCLDSPAALLSLESEANPRSYVEPENLAYVFYTSGSTGRPKGAAITHRSAVALLSWAQRQFPAELLSRVLASTSVSFDLSIFELFVPLSSGGTVLLAQDVLHLPTSLTAQGATLLNTVPSALTALLQAGSLPSTVRVVTLAGEALSSELVRQIYAIGMVQQVYNLYGPTEDTTYSTWALLPSELCEPVPIGRPIANSQVYVLDTSLAPVPPGVVGEIYLAGAGLARGYLHQPALTAERFVPHPFSPLPGARLYRSGDLARYLSPRQGHRADGSLEFVGRADRQVKLRGYRIELGEIEALLRQHPLVREAVVLLREDEPGDRRLVGYVVPRWGETGPTASQLRQYLGQHLPEYMLPQTYVLLDSLPLSPNGKLDRRALPVPDPFRGEAESDALSSRTALEELLAGIWEQVLGVEQVGLQDNFFEIGGHSLLATQVVARLNKVLHRDLPLRALFETPTVTGLAQRLEGMLLVGPRWSIPQPGSLPRPVDLPLSFAQQRLWFLNQLEPALPAYTMPVATRLSGHLQIRALEHTLNEIVRRHESLRTTFEIHDVYPVQLISPPLPLRLPVMDLSSLPPLQRDTVAHQLISEEIFRPFDLTQGPLLHACLLYLASNEHVLLLNLHHIICDGWSLEVLVRELSILYQAYTREQPSPLPALPLQYADYTLWQSQWLQGELLQNQLAYWQQQLAGAPTVLELPTDRPRPALQSFRGAHHFFQLPQRLSLDLKALSRREGVTLFMTLLAAFATLLSRYSGQLDLLIGTPIANRRHAELEDLIGLFINTLVLRIDLSGHPSMHTLLARVREMALQAYAHQDLPFEKLVEAVAQERVLSHSPLFQVMFSLQNASKLPMRLEELKLQQFSAGGRTAKFDLTLSMQETEQGLKGVLEYSTDLFETATIERMAAHLQQLLEGMIVDATRPLMKLPLLTEVERQHLLNDWNATRQPFPDRSCVHQLFEAQVERTPAALALLFEEHHLTYRELNQLSNQFAQQLRQHGVGPEVLVGVCLERSPKLVIALLAILKAGGAYLPLDPSYPPERLAFMLKDSQAGLLLYECEQQVATLHIDQDLPRLRLDLDALQTEAQENPDCIAHAENLAYVIYTSGSTGQPKGVLIDHHGICNLAQTQMRAFGVRPGDRILQFASMSFDASIWEVLMALGAGATLCLARQETQLPGSAFVQLLQEQAITAVTLPPSVLSVLPTIELPALHTLIVAGEACSTELVTCWANGRRFFNAYGPTETSICATLGACHPGGRPTIGRPIANTEVYVLDAYLQPVPIGVPGEVYLAGAGLARGYLHQPALTAERFVPHPFSPLPGARLYRSGDLAHYRADGSLEFVGRADRQVKLRGYRIELGEIEALLRGHPLVREAVVLLREDEPGDRRLVGYVVPPWGETGPTASQLRQYLGQQLPEYMLPQTYVLLDSLPLSPNGKLDRRALPVPDPFRGEAESGSSTARTALEELLAGIWEQVLGVEQVGLQDNFFEIGGHSLLATQVVARLNKVLHTELPLRTFFEAPTIAELAQYLNRTYQSQTTRSLPSLQPLPRPAELPLSFAQQRLWFLDQLEPDSPFYNFSTSLRLTGALYVAALERSLNEIVLRHESLRTFFRVIHGQPVQVVLSELRIPLVIATLEKLSASQQAEEVRRLIREEAHRPFDLALGPLMRVYLLRLGTEEHVLLLSLHHIICDGWSMRVLIYELSILYQAYTREQPSPLPALPLQYADYTLWQSQWLQGELLQNQLAYWQQQLAGAPTVLELPTDRPRPALQSFRGAHHFFQLPQRLSLALKALSRREGVTLFMTLLAAFATLLSRYSGQLDLLIGTPIANRRHAELEDLIGLFINTLVLRIDLSGLPSMHTLLARVREMALQAYAHQDLPFEKLVEVLEPERSLSHSPLFQVMFSLQNVASSPLTLAGLKVEPLSVESRTTKFDLGLSVQETAFELVGALEYNTDLFETATIERMGEHYRQLLEGMVTDPELPLRALSLLTQEERQQILDEWNQTQTAYPQRLSLSQMLEQQVQRTPDAVALVFEEEHLTYQMLNDRANQLAWYLRKQGVGPEVLVGICLERSVDLVMGVLGILKAGGAYVPLDPGYPVERLAFMLHDTNAPILLTQTHLMERLPTSSSRLLCMDQAWPLLASEAQSNTPDSPGPGTLAYVIYTSGSTGRPKGVLVPHQGVCNLAEVEIRVFGIRPEDRVLQFASLSFDASLWEIIMALYGGATLCLAARETLLPGAALVRLLQEQAITIVTLPPSALFVLPVGAFPALHTILTTGEACSAELVAAWATGRRFFNGYGPTETTICATLFECDDSGRKPPIGYPIANTQIYLLDAHMQPVPIGVPGELYIGGEGVTRGYHNRPEQTAERFVPHPFSVLPGQRLYRTGDLARYQANGLIEFVGRVDTQVKLRGYRIELGEIEAVLRQHPTIHEAVVILREDLPGEKRLIAYVVGARQRSSISVSELRRYLQEHLPEYMVPSALISLESLPLNANGKIDRRRLPAPEGLRPDMSTNYMAPQTPMEQAIAAAWQEILHIERIGIHDNFFDLGGHSLLMVQVQSKLREVLNRDLSIIDMFKYPTISSMAKYLDKKQGTLSQSRQSDNRVEKLSEGKSRLKRLRERTQRGTKTS